jgi:nitrite reductase/ring-hydroxylating ferredoxin subunit
MLDPERFAATASAYDHPAAQFDAELTKVGRGEPMGELLRRYWHPVCLSRKLLDLPVAMKALGEEIILFRKKTGEVGALYPRCIHRGASLFYGKITDNGLRCGYHGWAFDKDGRCTDQPCEPNNGGRAKSRFRQPWYPAEERYGLVFVYLGPIEKKPPLPRYDLLESVPEGWEIVADDTTIPSAGAGYMPCNWLQHHENGMDPHHVAIVHAHQFPPIMAQAESTYSFEKAVDRVLGRGISKIGPMMMDFRVDLITPTVRVIPHPMLPEPRPDGKCDNLAWTLPKDDHDTIVFTAIVQPVGAGKYDDGDVYDGKRWKELTPEEHQRLPGDFETQVSQGPITLHSQEHLTAGDLGIVYYRRNLKAALKDIEEGRDPPLSFGPSEIFIKTTASVKMMANPDFVEEDVEAEAPMAAATLTSPAVGKWALTLQSPMGEQKVLLTIESGPGGLAGSMDGSDGLVTIKDASEAGGVLRWKAAVKKPFPVTLIFDVRIESGMLAGTFKPGMFPVAKVTGVRA